MALYSGKIRDKSGIRKVELQARTETEARKQMERMGQLISFTRKSSLTVSRGLTADERQIFFNRMSSMIQSGVGTSNGLKLMRDTFSGKIQEVAGRLIVIVESGADLAEAMDQIGSPDFPEATLALIKAGSRSGETWRALRDAAEFEYQLHTIRKGSGKGLWMAIASFFIAGALILGSTFYAGPEIMNSPLIKAAQESGSVNIDIINQTAIVVSYIMLVLLIIGVFFGMLATLGRQVMPVKADAIILKIPFYKDLVLAKNNYIVLYGLALLIRSGVRIEEALRLSAENAPKGALRADLQNGLAAVKIGKAWVAPMNTLHPTDKAALSCAANAEQIALTLDILANQYRDLYARRLASFVPVLSMASAIFLTIAGGIIFGQTILPMLMASKAMLG